MNQVSTIDSSEDLDEEEIELMNKIISYENSATTVEMDAEPGDDVALTNMIDKQEHIQQTLMRAKGRSGSGKTKAKGKSNTAKKLGGNKKGKS